MKVLDKLFIPNRLLVFLIPLLVLFFYNPISSYFSQDDFYHLRQIMDKKVVDLPSFFIPSLSPEQTFYRPFSREVFNFIMYALFNLSPLPYHLVNLLLIFVVGWLIFWLVLTLTKNNLQAFFSTLLYLFNSVHSLELYYLSSVQTLFSTVLILLCLISYLLYLKQKRVKFLIYSLSSYILAVLSHESAVVGFFLILGLEILINKMVSKRILLFAFVLLTRGLVVILGNNLPAQAVYQPNFTPVNIVNSFSWFSLWSFGLPEMLTDFMTLTLKINPNLFKYYESFIKVVFPLFIIFVSLNLFIVIIFRKKILTSKLFLYLLLAFIFSLGPFLFFPQHRFSYYLSLPLVWFSIILGLLLSFAWSKQRLKVIVICQIIIFLIISFKTVSLNKDTNWAAKRARAAQVILSDVRSLYPKVGVGTTFYIKNDSNYPVISREWGSSSKQAFYILSGSDAFQLLYKDSTIKVYFEDIDGPKFLPKDVITYTAKFPF